jgi:hypothetical protein
MRGLSLPNPSLVLITALGNALVIAGCIAIYGLNAEGAGATGCDCLAERGGPTRLRKR